jgi:hypothetical protein
MDINKQVAPTTGLHYDPADELAPGTLVEGNLRAKAG